MDKKHENQRSDTGSQGTEPNEFKPSGDEPSAIFLQELEDFLPEKPMDSGDAFGAPTPARLAREIAFQAWKYLERHNPNQPLPIWVADYLREVAIKVLSDMGQSGGLEPASAHAALGLVGKQWPNHHPDSVYSIIQTWMGTKRPGGPIVDGRKAGAVRYIQEYMGNDPNVQVETVIEWYRKGQKSHKKALERERANGDRHREQEKLVDFEQAVTGSNTTCEEPKLVEFDHAISGGATNTDVKNMTALDQAIANKDWQA